MNRFLILATLLLAAPTWADPVKPENVEKITQALPAKTDAVAPKKARQLLVYSFTNGFRHGSIETGVEAMKMLGEKTGAFTVTHTEDSGVFEPESLAKFDGVLMLNTTGEIFKPKMNEFNQMSKEQKDAALQREERLKKSLVDFVESGKGLSGFHSATDTYKNWKAYNDMMGGAFAGHPWGGGSRVWVRIDDPENTLTRVFGGKTFEIQDEIYQFRDDTADRGERRVLLSLNPEKTDLSIGKHKNGDYPVSWVRTYGKGRIFYSSLGHNHHINWDANVLKFYLAGLQFALGDLGGVQTDPVPLKN